MERRWCKAKRACDCKHGSVLKPFLHDEMLNVSYYKKVELRYDDESI